jgi:hypothetical protein
VAVIVGLATLNGMIMTKEKKELKTNYQDPVKRFELAERTIWSQYPEWKRKVVTETRQKQIFNDRILCEFTREVITLAESEITLNEKLPPVPTIKQPKTIEREAAETLGNPS